MLKKLWKRNSIREQEYDAAREDLLKQTPIPVIWLFGKTGSGKSSITRFLTGIDNVEIGAGYKPHTRFSSIYAFPDEATPVMKFLDTRGIGEAEYGPSEDLQACQKISQLLVVTVRVMDHALEELVELLQKIRATNPSMPTILALTALHDAYPGEQHPTPDPFAASSDMPPAGIPDQLKASMQKQLERFSGLVDRVVPIDLTPPEEGFEQPHFGGERLKEAVVDMLPAAYRHSLLQIDDELHSWSDLQQRRTLPTIIGTSSLAATAAAVPVPWVDIPVVMGLQTHLIYQLAKIYDQPIDGQTITKLTAALGGRLAIRMALREALKFIPWVGMAANAAAAFAMTYATGAAWNWYFSEIERGHVPDENELRSIFQEQLTHAGKLWRAGRGADGQNKSEN